MNKTEALKAFANKIKTGSPTIDNWKGLRFELRTKDHNPPHIHVHSQNDEASFQLDGDLESGSLSPKQMKDVRTWFSTRAKEKLVGWECDSRGNWRRKASVHFHGDINAACSEANDYRQAIKLMGIAVVGGRFIECWFADGSHKIYDINDRIEEDPDIFAPLKDKKLFNNVEFSWGGLYWNDDIDLSEYELYRNGIELDE